MAEIEWNLCNMPPEVMNLIFEELNDIDLAIHRRVCAYWRNIIESLYHTYMEMNNCNWEAFVKGTTASKLRVKFTSLQYPIYNAPEFKDFVPRVNILELSGFIPAYNVVNILKEFRQLLCLVLNSNITVDTHEGIEVTNTTAVVDKSNSLLELTKLNIGCLSYAYDKGDLFVVAGHVGSLLKENCLKVLNLNSPEATEDILKMIYANIFENNRELNTTYVYDVIPHILDMQLKSIRMINFDYLYGVLSTKRPLFIEFYRQITSCGPSENTEGPQIKKSCLVSTSNRGFSYSLIRAILKIYETQSRMENLIIRYYRQNEVDQIQKIVKNNCETLKEITIISDEPIQFQSTYRLFSCKLFSSCKYLEQLTLSVPLEGRKVKLLDIMDLPPSIKMLSLAGFFITVLSESLRVAGSTLVNLTKLTLAHLPWLFHDEKPVVNFTNVYLQHLLTSFPKVKEVTLKVTPPNLILTREAASACGLEGIPDPVPDDFITWCQNGGDNNVVESFNMSIGEDWSPGHDVYKIFIRNQQ